MEKLTKAQEIQWFYYYCRIYLLVLFSDAFCHFVNTNMMMMMMMICGWWWNKRAMQMEKDSMAMFVQQASKKVNFRQMSVLSCT